jgi:secreted PhoX family phosphatase
MENPAGAHRMAHTSFQLDRRQFLKAGLGSAAALAFAPGMLARALAQGRTTVGASPYGALGSFDRNGIALPPGFSSRRIARGGELVSGTLYPWHNATDGQATFATVSGGAPDGGWILVANSEVPLPLLGGVSGVEFAPNGRIERAYRVLAGTAVNCAGGPTPWGTWLSCEEHADGLVHECDPTKLNLGVARPALGRFSHEAACVDPVHERLYLTEDEGDGCLYRFTPRDYPSLGAGLLEVAVVSGDTVSWAPVPNPNGGNARPTRYQVPAATHFDGGEGTWYDDGVVYFTTKGDERVWAYHTDTSELEVLYDARALGPSAPLSGVDNITVSPSGDIFVCEDGRDHDICMITPQFEVSRFLKLDPAIHSGPPEGTPFAGNETVGVVFSPDGSRMYFGAQRSFGILGVPPLPAGAVYEITGPFRQSVPADVGAPTLQVRAPKRRSIKRLLASGLPVKLELGQPSAVAATLRARGDGDERERGFVIARAESTVALGGDAALMLRPGKRSRTRLRRRRRLPATLEVTATDIRGRSVRVERKVLLADAKRKRPRGR